jgi:hypothetical protein
VEPLTAEEVLQLWERGERLRPAVRTLTLLARARKGVPARVIEDMTIGESEMTLLALRTTTLGKDFRGIDSCPDCRTLVELALDTDLLASVGAAGAPEREEGARSSSHRVVVDADGWQVRFRLPTIGDLVVVGEEADSARARARLLERCLQDAQTPEGLRAGAPELPPALQAQVAAAMNDADPAAQFTTAVECPDCGRVWQAGIDIAAFFWRELVVMARRLLREVHELASRYGWSESEILRMSAVRRHAYLEGRWA